MEEYNLVENTLDQIPQADFNVKRIVGLVLYHLVGISAASLVQKIGVAVLAAFAALAAAVPRIPFPAPAAAIAATAVPACFKISHVSIIFFCDIPCEWPLWPYPLAKDRTAAVQHHVIKTRNLKCDYHDTTNSGTFLFCVDRFFLHYPL